MLWYGMMYGTAAKRFGHILDSYQVNGGSGPIMIRLLSGYELSIIASCTGHLPFQHLREGKDNSSRSLLFT